MLCILIQIYPLKLMFNNTQVDMKPRVYVTVTMSSHAEVQ